MYYLHRLSMFDRECIYLHVLLPPLPQTGYLEIRPSARNAVNRAAAWYWTHPASTPLSTCPGYLQTTSLTRHLRYYLGHDLELTHSLPLSLPVWQKRRLSPRNGAYRERNTSSPATASSAASCRLSSTKFATGERVQRSNSVDDLRGTAVDTYCT